MEHINKITKTGKLEYTCLIYVPLQYSTYGGMKHYCHPLYNEKEIERDETGNIIECKVEMKKDIMGDDNKFYINFPTLFVDNAYNLINEDNADDIFKIYKEYITNHSYMLKLTISVINSLLKIYGEYNSYLAVFNIIENQKGYGYMGGVGCGKNVHHLTFNKIVGIKDGLPIKVNELAEFWLAGMLYVLKDIRKNKKYLRDIIAEQDLFVTLNAKPDCQKTVAHVNAHGFPIKGATIKNITCKKCK